jgi:hypothetical protein
LPKSPTTFAYGDVEPLIESLAKSAPLDPQAIYAFFYPESAKYPCDRDLGYHYEFTSADNQQIVYAVLPRCGTHPEGAGTALDEVTDIAGHELVEAATDPQPLSAPAFNRLDEEHAAWELALLGEVGDLCVRRVDPGDRPADLGYFVQRTWSNASARANHDPCVPLTSTATPTTVYFNAIAVVTEKVPLTTPDHVAQARGITLPATIDVHLASDGPLPPWQLTAVDDEAWNHRSARLSFVWSATQGQNGDTVKLTITPNAGVHGESGFFVIKSTSQDGKAANYEPVAYRIP